MTNKFGSSDLLEKAMAEALAAVERTEEKRKADDEAQAAPPASSAEDIPVELMPPTSAAEAKPAAPEVLGPDAKPAPQIEEPQVPREQLLRLAADFDNFRKRSQRELDDMRKYGIERLLKDLLPMFDNLDRAVVHAAGDKNPVIEGVRMVIKQATEILANYGVKGFSSVGQPFDPERHEAVGQIPTAEYAPGVVAEEMLKGYKIYERLLRPAAVMVAMTPPATAKPTEAERDDQHQGGAAQDPTAVRGDG